ncbi:SMI1/KNR4 family protein [Arcobacter aquimarinus]|uniref:SMI1/KNR4 family protein n=1 Tax=Arcobacter aquimarinus TaxID=1315211 RepID=A0AAE7B4C7_9BACT|nr:SMI1/KNR4 family protein [Arcobacter aquimarinus]QKE25770.1 SMI1/KNR4 family protein [Arcobacter aquimarinus]RXI35205.1 molybdenum cofactor biosynthesis protein MoeA [Arcobacter aquimarinus]
MNEKFEKFKQWLTLNYSDGLLDLNPPATNEEIEELKNALGVDLPDDFISVLKIHNGQKGDLAWLFDSQEFLSTKRIIEEFNTWKNLLEGELQGKISTPDDGVKSDWWNVNWIPFTSDGCGDHYCIDLSPTASGTKGQIITLWYELGEREIVAQSFSSWFDEYIEQLYSGDLVYSKEYNSIVHKDELE